jgi:glucan phosphoethanolaminetransferase (alkaline phosphatase superfamily)
MPLTRAEGSAGPKDRPWRLMRALGQHARARRAIVLALPALLIVASDIALRGSRLAAFPAKYLGTYGFAVLQSAILWGVLLACASARRGWLRWAAAGSFVILATTALGTQIYFYRQYSTYLNLDATLWGTTMGDSVFGQISADGRHFMSSVAPPLLISTMLVALGRRLVRTRRRTATVLGGVAPVAVLAALLLPCSYRSVQGSTPDVIYFHALGGLAKQLTGIEEPRDIRPKRRTPPALAAIEAKPSKRRNVLFVLTESIRADLACSKPTTSCPVMPFTNEATPQRLGFTQMRSNSSTTAIQLAVLWSGLQPNAGREALHNAPLLFDYAHAAGIDTAYWSSHHMMFANSRLFVQDLPTTHQCGATNLDSLADIDTGADDRLLTARIKTQLESLHEPFFAVAHYGNTHVPYIVDDADAPFQPAFASKAADDNEAYRNYYKNAVHRQDKTIAELVDHVRGLALSERTVIFYTADHGEQFREHGQMGHTGSLFDVEIHVPAWIDAPPETLTSTERQAIVSHEKDFTFHTDVTPTLLDLMGLLDEPQLASYTDAMVGSSLLRKPLKQVTLEMSNCSGVWGCAFENWGVMRGPLKVISREWDNAWLCYDVTADPAELSPLDNEACGSLRAQADRVFGGLPGKQ